MNTFQPALPDSSPVRPDCTNLIGRIFLCTAGLLLITTYSFAGESCVTADCHGSMGQAAFVHEPVAGMECDACHVGTGKVHPGQKGAFALAEQGAVLCLQCHDKPGEGKKQSHPPVEKDCTGCHNPHQGSRKMFFHGPVGELCLNCHEQIKNIIQDAGSEHEPVAAGECLACHIPHGSEYSPLLKSYYPRDTYIPFKEENFSLCFECHEKEAFVSRVTSDATNFRNGNQNLHYLHVNRSKGRVCVNCHGVHGADLPKLIHSTSPAFGVWNIPIDFQKNATGATCIIGCHKEKSYDRVNKVANP